MANESTPKRPQQQTKASRSVAVPADLADAAAAEARARGISLSFLVGEALRDFLPRLIPVDRFKLTVD